MITTPRLERRGGKLSAAGPPPRRLPATPSISLEWRGSSLVTGMTLKPLGTSQPPLTSVQNHSQHGEIHPDPGRLPLASAHLHFYSITISKNPETKKKNCRAPLLQQSCMEGLEGSAGLTPQAGSWVGQGGPPLEQGSLSPASPSETLLIFPDSGEAGWASNVFHPRKGEACSH